MGMGRRSSPSDPLYLANQVSLAHIKFSFVEGKTHFILPCTAEESVYVLIVRGPLMHLFLVILFQFQLCQKRYIQGQCWFLQEIHIHQAIEFTRLIETFGSHTEGLSFT
jgi:hypothetical protein